MRNKLGQRAADTGEVVFEDVEIPKGALLGAEGEGFKVAMRTFDRSRPDIGAIAQFRAVQFMLADMAIDVEAMRLLTYKAA